MFDQIAYVIVAVSDMSKSVRFYRDQLGMNLKFESKEWTEFQTGTTTLALHPAREKLRSLSETGDLVAGTCSIGLNVADLDKTFNELSPKGVHFVMKPSERAGEGIKLAVCIDPDGLPISIAQPTPPNQLTATTPATT